MKKHGTRLAKFENNLPYGYEGGEWVYMPSLFKIQNDITDYEEVTEEDAEQIIRGFSLNYPVFYPHPYPTSTAQAETGALFV